ncbi:MAG: hypothetical protein Q8R82_12580 [Hyphomonadaceae bacterium]|nr:hypothetical protein [Hyphomonadaceae bacterium]
MLGRYRRILTAVTIAAGLAACSPSGPVAGNEEKTGEWVKSELLKAETQGAMGDVFSALRTAEPEIYAKLVDAATRAAADGRPPYEAGVEVRPLYLARFTELGKTAADGDINELLAFSGDQMAGLMAIDPQLCVIVANGGADPRMQQLPAEMMNREMTIMARVIRAGEQNGAAASLDEINSWIGKFANEYPAAVEGLAIMGKPGPTDAEATAICNGNIAMTQALGKEEPATRAKLFRGLLQQS